jgi:hypothetical protein
MYGCRLWDTIIRVNPYDQKIYFYVYPWIQQLFRWPAQPCLIGGHNDNIISGVDHPDFKSNRATSNDGMWQHRGTSVVLQATRDSANPTKQGVKGLDKLYGVHSDMFLWLSCTLYQYCIYKCITYILMSGKLNDLYTQI